VISSRASSPWRLRRRRKTVHAPDPAGARQCDSAARVLECPTVLETSLTTSAVSRDTLSVQAAGAGSHQPRVGGGGRAATVSVSDVHASTLEISHHVDDGVAHHTSLRSRRTMMTRTNSRRREAGRLFILSVTDHLDHVSTQAIPHTGLHRAAARAGARRQNSA
jgi:hypothetical protein